MGEAATKQADYVVVTSDNPRGEDPESIVADIRPGLQGDRYEIVLDRKEAIARIINAAQPKDAVILAGKGAEIYQEIKGTRHPFDDTAEAKLVLASLGYRAQAAEDGS